MYEVIVTRRTDFSEYTWGRYATEAEALDVAGLIWVQHKDKVVRTWVRLVREARATYPE